MKKLWGQGKGKERLVAEQKTNGENPERRKSNKDQKL